MGLEKDAVITLFTFAFIIPLFLPVTPSQPRQV